MSERALAFSCVNARFAGDGADAVEREWTSRERESFFGSCMVTDADTLANDCTTAVVEVTTSAGARMFDFLDETQRAEVLDPFVRALALDACDPQPGRTRDVVERAAALAIAARDNGIDISELLSRVARLVFLTERNLGDLRPELRQTREWRAHWLTLDEMSSRASIYAFSREAFASDTAWNRALDTISTNPAGAANAVRRAAQDADAGANVVIASDVSGTILYWNKAATRLYGWESAEVLGHNIMHVMPTSQSVAEAEAIMRRLAAGEAWSGMFLVRDKRGVPMKIAVTDTPVRFSGVIVGVVGVSKTSDED